MGRKNKAEVAAANEEAKYGKNYAGKTEIAERALRHCIDTVIQAKTNRKSKEMEWLEDLRLWSNQISDAQMYQGRSNLFVPELHNQTESAVSRFQQGLFPNDDYLHCLPLQGTLEDDAKKIQEAVFYELDYKNNLPEISERYQRQKVLYGTAFFRGHYVDEQRKIFVRNKKGGTEMRQVPKFRGVKWNVCDTFRVYVYPETVVSIDQASMVFEEDFVKLRDLKANPLYEVPSDLQEVASDLEDYSWVDTTRMSMANLASASALRPQAVHIIECWTDFDIVTGEFCPCVITIANCNRVIRVQKNPFWHQMSPYLAGRYVKAPGGEFYGRSLPERLRSLQYMMNDLANQTMDSLTYSLNPICLIDPGFAGDVNSFKLQPGAKWFASPQGVDFKNFPDVSVAGFQGMQQIRGLIQQFSDLAPSVAPQLSGKVRSATQAQAVQSEVSSNMKNMIRGDEYDVLSQMGKMTHILLQQFAGDDTYQILVQGPDKGSWISKNVRPEDLVGDVHFIWRGSSAAEKTAIRSQQLLGFFNMAVNMAALMPDQVDLPALYKMVAKEGFDLELDEIFTKDKQSKTVDPELENLALDQEQEVVVNLGDNFQVHMESHQVGAKAAKTYEAKLAYARHMEKHQVQEQAKQMLLQQQAKLAAMQQTGMMGSGGGQGQPQGGPEGNQRQVPASPANAMSGMRAVEPNI